MRLEKTKTKSWPSGKAWKFLEGLLKKYQPKDLLVRAEQKKKLMLIGLNKGDPENLGTRIAQLEIEIRERPARVQESCRVYYGSRTSIRFLNQ